MRSTRLRCWSYGRITISPRRSQRRTPTADTSATSDPFRRAARLSSRGGRLRRETVGFSLFVSAEARAFQASGATVVEGRTVTEGNRGFLSVRERRGPSLSGERRDCRRGKEGYGGKPRVSLCS